MENTSQPINWVNTICLAFYLFWNGIVVLSPVLLPSLGIAYDTYRKRLLFATLLFYLFFLATQHIEKCQNIYFMLYAEYNNCTHYSLNEFIVSKSRRWIDKHLESSNILHGVQHKGGGGRKKTTRSHTHSHKAHRLSHYFDSILLASGSRMMTIE